VFLYIHPRLAPCGSLNQQTARLDGVELGTVELEAAAKTAGVKFLNGLQSSGVEIANRGPVAELIGSCGHLKMAFSRKKAGTAGFGRTYCVIPGASETDTM